jgi:hypothetical protein
VIDVQELSHLFRNRREDLLRRRLTRDDGCHAPRRSLLLGKRAARHLGAVGSPAGVRGEDRDEHRGAEVSEQAQKVLGVRERRAVRRREPEPVVSDECSHRGRGRRDGAPQTRHRYDGKEAGDGERDGDGAGVGGREDQGDERECGGSGTQAERELGR